MDKTVVNTYLQKLKELSCLKGETIRAWRYRTADYLEAGKHTVSTYISFQFEPYEIKTFRII